MKSFEDKFEFEMTDEPETIGELSPPSAADMSGWDSLADVPFAGEEKCGPGDLCDIPEDSGMDNSIETLDVSLDSQMDEIPEDVADFDSPSAMDMVSYDQADDIPEELPDFTEDESIETLDELTDSSYQDDIPEDSPDDLQESTDVSEWLGDINPNFDPFDMESPYCNNCGSCAYAVYQRLEGNTDACASAENIGYNSEMEALTGMEQVSMSPDDIQARLLEEGDGAHAIIGIDRAEGPGHWFNAACIDGKVVAIDGQTGEITDWPPDYGDVVNWEMSVKKGE